MESSETSRARAHGLNWEILATRRSARSARRWELLERSQRIWAETLVVAYDCRVLASGTFSASGFTPTTVVPTPPVRTGLPVLVATMEKRFEGEIRGHSSTLFSAAFDQRVGTYVAMESFEGTLNGRSGAFNFVHSATTSGDDRSDEFFLIVPSSGTQELTGITGVGGISIDSDGTHRMWLDYEIP